MKSQPFPWPKALAATLAAFSLFSCSHASKAPSGDERNPPPSSAAPRSQSDTGPYARKISTRSEEAQRLFNQGLNLMFAFNLDEAERSFREAGRLDPEAPMPWWGVAYANGPHYNAPTIDPEHSQRAHEAIQNARSRLSQATPVERALIEAMSARYSETPPKYRKPLDQAYARAMRKVWQRHPDDPEAGVLYAEAMMNLRPWELWTADKKPNPGTPEIVSTLSSVLTSYPDHPGALHLYIHALEASPHPERAVLAAERLAAQHHVRGGGHLVHMPSHIYMLVGRYAEATSQNKKASEADQEYLGERPAPSHFFHMYAAHNLHFLTSAAMMEGRAVLAMEAARELHRRIPLEVVQSMPDMLDFMYAAPYQVMARFGLWDQALSEPEPAPGLAVSQAYWRYARGLALSARGQTEGARQELQALRALQKSVPKAALAGFTPAKKIFGLAATVLEADLAAKRGDRERSLRLLQRAARIEGTVHYDEPPDWFQPVNQILGVTLLEAGRPQEAEAAFRADLARNPRNGWSLYGLWKSLEKRNAPAALELERSFRQAWARADLESPLPQDRILVGMASRPQKPSATSPESGT